jgi:hypothetical protein
MLDSCKTFRNRQIAPDRAAASGRERSALRGDASRVPVAYAGFREALHGVLIAGGPDDVRYSHCARKTPIPNCSNCRGA